MSDRFPVSAPDPTPDPEIVVSPDSGPADDPPPPRIPRSLLPPAEPESVPPVSCAAPPEIGASGGEKEIDSTRVLLDRLRALAARARGTGAAIYRGDDRHGGAEIVVSYGRGTPPLLEPDALSVRDGACAYGGQIWHLEKFPEPILLFVARAPHSPPIDLSAPALGELQALWSETSRCRDLPHPLERPEGFPEMIGSSPQLIKSLQLIAKVAATRVSVLILGESGTGKELVGRAIHRLSKRTGRFVSENCAAISDSLLEGELFGAEKGSYTGAHAARAGLIEEADRGTLFLDEIGEMGTGLQTKLLRVLQEREVRRIGSSEARPVDFRVLSATHRDLDQQVEQGAFRADLLFRLDVVRVELPPLRERSGDVPILTQHFLEEIAAAHELPVPEIDPAALDLLQSAPWPGNLRELRNELERAFALSPRRIGFEDLSPRIRQKPITHSLARQIRQQIGTHLPSLEKIVFGGLVREVLKETGGNKAEAARRLGIAKTNLYRRLDRYGIPYDKRGS